MSRFCRHTLIFLLSAALLLAGFELLYANRVRLMGGEVRQADLANVVADGKITGNGDTLCLFGESKVTFSGINAEVNSFTLFLADGRNTIGSFSASVTDDASAIRERNCGNYRILPTAPSATFFLDSNGAAHDITLSFESSCAGMILSGVTWNYLPPISFHFVRYLLLLAATAAVWFTVKRKWWKIPFRATFGQTVTLWVLISVLSLTIFGTLGGFRTEAYPLKKSVESYPSYIQLFDAFYKGQLNLDIAFDAEAYEALDNPYDYYERRQELQSAGVWDHAYYQGKLYCYFGAAPVILIYYPFYLLSGRLPNDDLATALLAFPAMLAALSAFLALLKRFRLHPPFLLVLAAVFTVASGSLIQVLQLHPSMYYMAVIGGIGAFALTVSCVCRAGLAKSNAGRRVLLAAAAIGGVLIVTTRPNYFLYCLALLPLLWQTVFAPERQSKTRIWDCVCFFAPLLLGACAVMVYNAARFGNVFEFGASYQLTFTDIRSYKLRLYLFFPAVYHYLLQPPEFTGHFPFLTLNRSGLDIYRNYLYVYGSVGAFSFPATWGIFGAGAVSRGKEQRTKRLTYLLLIFCAVALAFADLCLAGAHLRYLGDLLYPLILVGVLVLLETAQKALALSEQAAHTVFRLVFLLFLLSVLLGAALLFSNEANNIFNQYPAFYMAFTGLFQ